MKHSYICIGFMLWCLRLLDITHSAIDRPLCITRFTKHSRITTNFCAVFLHLHLYYSSSHFQWDSNVSRAPFHTLFGYCDHRRNSSLFCTERLKITIDFILDEFCMGLGYIPTLIDFLTTSNCSLVHTPLKSPIW